MRPHSGWFIKRPVGPDPEGSSESYNSIELPGEYKMTIWEVKTTVIQLSALTCNVQCQRGRSREKCVIVCVWGGAIIQTGPPIKFRRFQILPPASLTESPTTATSLVFYNKFTDFPTNILLSFLIFCFQSLNPATT